ncbi:MAG TPA: ATP-binding protein [Anaerovoracaceae bacterium]|nr:ATP-binding protein [Anaerovoracaceae bacterium]
MNNKNKESQWSLVMKLNLKIMLNTLVVLISINIFLCAAVFSFTFWQAEEDAVMILNNQTMDETRSNNNFFYLLEPKANKPEGFKLWSIINQGTPLQNHEVLRDISFNEKYDSFYDKFLEMKYSIFFVDEKISITLEVGNKIFQYALIFKLLLIFEAILLISGALKNRKKIRRILRPISDMTQMTKKAQTMAPGARNTVDHSETKRLRELAGTISSIDATKLDKRLPVDETQKELKDLANAINSMLDRIDEAYTSQVRFVSDASHELRTPIAVIQGYANLLDRWGKNDPETMQEAIDAIKSESENMKDLVEQLLFLARGDNETLQLYPEVFDCGELVEEILQEAQMIDGYHRFRKKEGTSGLINADRQLMKQAIRILVDNSIKYTPQDGEIVVSVNADNKEKGFVRISVQDNGIGIDPDNIPYIFDRFYRSDESRARKTGGSGLGLAIMKWIIDRHAGTIEVISRKDIGTRTTIVMPETIQDKSQVR